MPADLLFPKLPAAKPPAQSQVFRPDILDALVRSQQPSPAPPSGITVSGPAPDWADERADFLARGSSPEIGARADAMGIRADIDDNMLRRRPDLLQAESSRLALDALRNQGTRSTFQTRMADPAYAREQEGLDARAAAQTYTSPELTGQRTAQIGAEGERSQAMFDLARRLNMDPRMLAELQRAFEQKRELATIEASGRNPLLGMMGGGAGRPGAAPGGGAGPAPVAGGGALTEDTIRQRVLARGGTEGDVLATISDARARGMLP
jgi:hypothetical protein